MKPRLVIMAKAPIMGAAKTRLARDIGPAHAKRIYRAMMACVLRNTADPRWETVLAVTGLARGGANPAGRRLALPAPCRRLCPQRSNRVYWHGLP